MTLPQKINRWIQSGLTGCAFVLMGFFAIPACLSFLLIALVWQTTEALLKALEGKNHH